MVSEIWRNGRFNDVPHVRAKGFSLFLRPDVFAVITCPDLQAVVKLAAEDKLLELAYNSPAGLISPIDILHGHSPAQK
jgi:hypothetical protein